MPINTIYLLPLHKIYNPETVKTFGSFNQNDSKALYSALYLNNKQNIDKLNSSTEKIFCFDSDDKNFLPDIFKPEEVRKFYNDTNDLMHFITKLADYQIKSSVNNLILLSDSLGISSTDIEQAFSLLSMEDEAVVIGKSCNNSVTFIGVNNFNKDLFGGIDFNNFEYEKMLSIICKHNVYVHVIESKILVKNESDFKVMYDGLSKKESIEYCSDEMHEKFTNLFIEYKDLLKQ